MKRRPSTLQLLPVVPLLLAFPPLLRAQIPDNQSAATPIICTIEPARNVLPPVVVDGWPDIPPTLPGDSLGTVPALLARGLTSRYQHLTILRLHLNEGGHVTQVLFDSLGTWDLPEPELQQQLAVAARRLRFRPAFRRGQPAPCRLLVQVRTFPAAKPPTPGR